MPSVVDMQRLGWGDPDDFEYRARHVVDATVAGRTFHVRREVAPLFRALVIFLERAGVDVSSGILDDWSYVNRDIRGYPGVKSYHAWGLAIDVDSTKNPLGSTGTSFPLKETRAAVKATGLTWGYEWRPPSRPDPMHFEFRGTPEEARAAVRRLRRTHPMVWRRAVAE